MKKILPSPKSITLSESLVPFSGEIEASEVFSDCRRVFLAYFEEELRHTAADGKAMSLLTDTSLPEEGYRISVTEDGILVYAATAFGMHHAMSLLLELSELCDGVTSFPLCEVCDAPDLPYRGLMIDPARYPTPMKMFYDYVDLCYRCRISHIQMHLTDDQNFTVALKEFPKLHGCYSPEELTELAEYAYERGIIMIPEVDIPGHTAVLSATYPEIFGNVGVMSASESSFAALKRIYTEVHRIFPHSQYIHIGGDEAFIHEWEKCDISKAYMKEHGIGSIDELYAEFLVRATEIIFGIGCTPIVWEGFAKEYNDRFSKDVIVIPWESLYQHPADIAAAGFRIINCAWEPLYVVTPEYAWSREDILAWDVYTWRNWNPKTLAYPDGIRIPAEGTRMLGAQLCVWRSSLFTLPNADECVEREFETVCNSLPALAERTWNAF